MKLLFPLLLMASLLLLLAGRMLVGLASAPVRQFSQPCSQEPALAVACQDAAEWLLRQLDAECQVVVRAPLVVAGDLSAVELERRHRETIAPLFRAISAEYRADPPRRPILVLLFADEPSYRRHAKSLFGDADVSSYGYYRPHLRTIVWNAGRGTDALGHELTHALMADDFPQAPEWFSEGLASLHETARIRPDGTGLEGVVNWRLDLLRPAIPDGRLRTLEQLVAGKDFRGPDERLNYAHARAFCLFMQHRGVLRECYRRLRSSADSDPTRVRAVLSVFAERNWQELDAEFRQWLTAAMRTSIPKP